MNDEEDISTSLPADTTPADDGKSFESSMDSAMNSVFDKLEGKSDKQDHREASLGPPTVVEESKDKLGDTFSKVYDYLEMSPQQQAQQAKERAAIDDIKQFAAEHNLSFAEAQSYKQGQEPNVQPGQQPQLAPELSKVAEATKALGYDAPFHEVVDRYNQIDRLVQSDPVQGVTWIAQQAGLNPLQLAQQIALRYGQESALLGSAEHVVNDFFTDNADAAKLEDAMLAAVESGKVRRTGNVQADLEAAFKYAQRQAKKEGTAKRQGKHLDRSLSEIYDRMQKR
jgi:hypothetical protein